MTLVLALAASAGAAALDGVMSVQARAAALARHVELTLPAGAGPHPLAVLMPGCLGWQPHHERWRASLVERGFAVLHVDSFAARGLAERAVRAREVCAGRRVFGGERAGDLAAVLAGLGARAELDLERAVLFGWSHGGWAVLEFLGDFAAARAPVNLEQRPALADFEPRAAILYYPYCGRGPRAPAVAYPTATRTIIFHGTADGITSPAQCRSRTAALKALGANVEFVALPAVRHGFDNHAQAQVFDGKATALSTAMAAVILEQAMAPSSSPGEP